MREECKHFQTRTYASGEVTRFCVLGVAPDAPYRCPDDCASYARRVVDVGWQRGTLVPGEAPPDPTLERPGAADLLHEAEAIVNAATPRVASDVTKAYRAPWWRRVLKRSGRRR